LTRRVALQELIHEQAEGYKVLAGEAPFPSPIGQGPAGPINGGKPPYATVLKTVMERESCPRRGTRSSTRRGIVV